MNKVVLSLLTVLSWQALAQDAPKEAPKSNWKKATQLGANFNQASFSNWTAGGQNAVGLNFFFNAKGDYAKDKLTWTNDLQTQFGFQSIGGQFRKSIDRIFFDSKVGHKLSSKWNLFGSVNFQTQFAQGFDYQVEQGGARRDFRTSDLFAPAFITEAIGLEYKPNKNFSMQFAPISMRQTIVSADNLFVKTGTGYLNQNVARYGVLAGKSLRNEVGLLQIVTNFDKDIAENINLKVRHQIFVSYDDIAAMDNRVDVKVAAKINKYFSATFDAIILYDQDQSFSTQFAQNFGVGFLYNFAK
jgi:Protein of unknown function (DUF3078)/Protein of unknown function, DUF481